MAVLQEEEYGTPIQDWLLSSELPGLNPKGEFQSISGLQSLVSVIVTVLTWRKVSSDCIL